jgi:hypothetical protein
LKGGVGIQADFSVDHVVIFRPGGLIAPTAGFEKLRTDTRNLIKSQKLSTIHVAFTSAI